MQWISAPDVYYLTVIALIQAIRCVPASLRLSVARAAGTAAYRLSRHKRRRAETSLARWQGTRLRPPDRRRIVRRMFQETWREILWWPEVDSAAPDIEVHGLEHLQNALAAGRGAILWESTGFGRRILAKAVLRSHGVALYQIHGRNHLGGFLTRGSSASLVREHVIRRFFDGQELRVVAEITRLPAGNAMAYLKPLIERLARNAVVCVSGDGRAGHKLISRRFLGHSVAFATGAASLARLSGAPLVPMFCFEETGGRSVLILEPPVEPPEGVSREERTEYVVQELADRLAERVARHPEQYRNWHLLEDVTVTTSGP